MATIIKDCPHCGGRKMTMTCLFSSPSPAGFRALFVCNGCHGPLAAQMVGLTSNVEPHKHAADISQIYGFKRMYPNVLEISAPEHTPPNIANRFIEAEDTFRRQRWTLCVGGFRSTLDIATKDIAKNQLTAQPKVASLKLYDRIEALAAAHVITTAMKDWAHEVRGAGNDALHEEEEMTEEDAVQMRLLTKTFLQYAYELPGEIAERKAQKLANP